MKKLTKLCAAGLALVLLAGCSSSIPASNKMQEASQELAIILDQEPAILAATPATLDPNKIKSNDKAEIDYSGISAGYIRARRKQDSQKRYKVQIVGPTTTYTYDLKGTDWTQFSITDGNGKYTAKIFENVSGTSYTLVLSYSFSLALDNEFLPFLISNQYVNYDVSTLTITKGKELCSGVEDDFDKIKNIYSWVITNIKYDKELAKNVKSGYLPVLDNTITSLKGICFDYAALMTGMLRSQGIPCKLVIGYTGSAYHAWINVYSEKDGWVNSAIYFDGEKWELMDPTFASNGKESQAIMNYIGDGRNYISKYFY